MGMGVTIEVTVGVLLAALLFMLRMVEISGADLIGSEHPEHGRDLPRCARASSA